MFTHMIFYSHILKEGFSQTKWSYGFRTGQLYLFYSVCLFLKLFQTDLQPIKKQHSYSASPLVFYGIKTCRFEFSFLRKKIYFKSSTLPCMCRMKSDLNFYSTHVSLKLRHAAFNSLCQKKKKWWASEISNCYAVRIISSQIVMLFSAGDWWPWRHSFSHAYPYIRVPKPSCIVWCHAFVM